MSRICSGSNTRRSAAIPGAMKPRSCKPSRCAAMEDILRTASSRLRTLSSLTYLAITRGKAPNALGWELSVVSGFTGDASVSIMTYSASSASHFCSSFMLCGFTLTPPACTRSKKAFHGSTPSTSAASVIERLITSGSTSSDADTIRTLSQFMPTCRYQFSQSEVVSTSRRSSARNVASPSVSRNGRVPAA